MLKRITLDGDNRDFLLYRWGSGGTVEIFDLAIGTERGVGKGRRLINLLLERVKDKTHLIFAITRVNNFIAREFYTHVGFQQCAVLPNFYVGAHAVMYTLPISKPGDPDDSKGTTNEEG